MFIKLATVSCLIIAFSVGAYTQESDVQMDAAFKVSAQTKPPRYGPCDPPSKQKRETLILLEELIHRAAVNVKDQLGPSANPDAWLSTLTKLTKVYRTYQGNCCCCCKRKKPHRKPPGKPKS